MALILFVDDDPVLLAAASTILRRAGHEVEVATDGLDGLKKAVHRPPDLVVTDVHMPRMDGWEFVRQLRATKEHAWTPVFFLTDHASGADRVRGFNLGADDYLAKPIAFEELGLRVARALETRNRLRSSVSLPEAAGGEAGGVVKRPVTAVRGKLDQIGLATLLSMVDLERRTGELSVQTDAERRGLLLVREGRVITAKVYGDAPEEGADAVFEMLRWSAGDFAYRPMGLDADVDDTIGQPTGMLLLEGARRIDESGA